MDLNKENIRKIRGIIIFTVITLVIGVNYRSVIGLFATFVRIIMPFLIGAAIAFILNVPMRAIEKYLTLKKSNKLCRPISLILTIVLLVGLLVLVIFVVVPQLLETLMSLQDSIPRFLADIQKKTEDLFSQNPDVLSYIKSIQVDWAQIMKAVVEFLSVGAGSVLSSTVSAAVSFFSGVTTFGIAFIFAVYILLQKENLGRQFILLFRAFFSRKITDAIWGIAGLTERTFSNFLTGQCVEAVILGTMFFITLSLFRLPYALLIGVLIAFTALIPIFGAFIGCAVGVFLMLMVNPLQALYFLVLFFILQQLEGNLIYPHVVGNSVGLPSIWVLVAVTIGGSAMGIVGMLIFIPLCSVLYTILRAIVRLRLERRLED